MPAQSWPGVAPLRLVSVNVLGRHTRQPSHLPSRSRLLQWAVEAIVQAGWTRLSAVLFPAGYLPSGMALGPIARSRYAEILEQSAIAAVCAPAAERLNACTGALLVIGVDTPCYDPEFGGDQLMVAWAANRVTGFARKIFPSDSDTNEERSRPLLIYPDDADDLNRVAELPCGRRALLCTCYDAFIFSHLGQDLQSPWPAIRFVPDGRQGWRWAEVADRRAILSRFRALMASLQPSVALVGVHGFERQGREVYWQRHGIATASAGLPGVAVGAAHFRDLPDVEDSHAGVLAASGVPRRHLGRGIHRRAHRFGAVTSLTVTVPGSPHLAAVARLFEFANGEGG